MRKTLSFAAWAGFGTEKKKSKPCAGFSTTKATSCLVFCFSIMLDVLTPLSDCRQESVEKMEWRISGVSYMYWMDFYNGILCCEFLCARLISVSLFSVSLFRLPRRGLPRPTCLLFRLPRRGLPRPTCLSFPATTPRATTPHLYPRAITPLPPLHGYHACVYISRLSRHSLVLLLDYHTGAISLHHTRTSGYHTRHSS